MKLIIKPEFDEKLKKLQVKTRFVNNLKEQNDHPEFGLKSLNKYESFKTFIARAFFWHITPEGHDYWDEISKK